MDRPGRRPGPDCPLRGRGPGHRGRAERPPGHPEPHGAARQAELEKALADQIAQYKQEVSALAGSGSAGSASYTLVTLTSGQTMSLEVGCEVLLRVGTVKVNANTSPALIDVSTGGTINGGASLTKNHLYMATISDRTLTPTAATVKLLVRGGYSIK